MLTLRGSEQKDPRPLLPLHRRHPESRLYHPCCHLCPKMAQVETKGVAKSVSRGGWGSDADQEMSLREGTQISGVLNHGVSVVTGQLKGCQKYKAT